MKSTLITAQIDNLLLIKELPAQSQLQKHKKQVVTLPTVNNKDTRTTQVALLVCLYLLPLTSPHCLHLCFEQVFTCWVSTKGAALK